MPDDQEIEREWRPLTRWGGAALIVGSALTVLGLPLGVIVNSTQANLSISSAIPTGLAQLQTQALPFAGFWTSIAAFELLSLVSFMALYVALKRVNRINALLALLLWAVGVTIDIAGDISVRLSLIGISNGYASAANDMQRAAYVAASQSAWTSSGVNAFIVGVPLGASLILTGRTMLKGTPFGRATGYLGIIAGILEMVIFTGGDLTFWGLSPALQVITAASGGPLLLWSFLTGYRLYKLK